MPANNETLATLSRFVSVAVLSCLVITGGLWFYHNRAGIAGGGSSDGSTWFTRWAGIDHTKLKDEYTKNIMSEQMKSMKFDYEIDPDWIKNFHGGAGFDWDR
jgi:hypothetical protein